MNLTPLEPRENMLLCKFLEMARGNLLPEIRLVDARIDIFSDRLKAIELNVA